MNLDKLAIVRLWCPSGRRQTLVDFLVQTFGVNPSCADYFVTHLDPIDLPMTGASDEMLVHSADAAGYLADILPTDLMTYQACRRNVLEIDYLAGPTMTTLPSTSKGDNTVVILSSAEGYGDVARIKFLRMHWEMDLWCAEYYCYIEGPFVLPVYNSSDFVVESSERVPYTSVFVHVAADLYERCELMHKTRCAYATNHVLVPDQHRELRWRMLTWIHQNTVDMSTDNKIHESETSVKRVLNDTFSSYRRQQYQSCIVSATSLIELVNVSAQPTGELTRCLTLMSANYLIAMARFAINGEVDTESWNRLHAAYQQSDSANNCVLARKMIRLKPKPVR